MSLLRLLKSIPQRIKFLWQRLTRGWDDSDLWSLDYTIAKFALPRLREFKLQAMGHPSSLTEEEWNMILDKMIWSMEYVQKELDGSDRYLPEELRVTDREVDLIVTSLYRDIESTEEERKAAAIKFDRRCRAMEDLEERCQEGLDLFGRYFRALWS